MASFGAQCVPKVCHFHAKRPEERIPGSFYDVIRRLYKKRPDISRAFPCEIIMLNYGVSIFIIALFSLFVFTIGVIRAVEHDGLVERIYV